ncbi:adenosine deaminase-like protein [Phalaenopsis equestris]|uniref:adenosine deaminase-like protein n=1 Tax=Phalaenopsis equestris TaxID=78828 RepID=UPI0009E46AC3|nr:adenosine deaminase-like protein [Phalaenopsis equestris]
MDYKLFSVKESQTGIPNLKTHVAALYNNMQQSFQSLPSKQRFLFESRARERANEPGRPLMEKCKDLSEMKEWCRAIPKIELHAHLNGCIRDSTLLELAKLLGEKGVINFGDVEHIIRKCGRSLTECFQLFDLFHILTTDHETISRITKEVIEDFAAEEVVYLELRTTPKSNEAKGMTKRSYMKAVVNGLRSVETVDVSFINFNGKTENFCESMQKSSKTCMETKKIYVRLLLSIDRRETMAAAMETVSLALEMREFGVVGIDLSGNPVVGEWTTFLPALKYAKEQGLPVTLHCGEVSNKMEIQAMLNFSPNRIGHACFLDEDDWHKARFLRIPVEICLTSNLRTERFSSIDLHHFANLYNSNHPLVLCTDDTGLFSTSLSNEYYLAAETFGLDKKDIFKLGANAIEYVFADNEVKKAIREIFRAFERRIAD